MRHPLAAFFCLFALAPNCYAQEQHADYVVLGKSINHRQAADGNLNLLNTVFFAEIFLTEDGLVTNGKLTGPGDATDGFRFPEGKIQFLAGTRQYSIEALTDHYPDSTYHFDFDTPDGNVRGLPATFVRDQGEMRNPGPIEIDLYQNGAQADPTAIDPDHDLVVRWNEFAKGSADPRGIIDDMIYVIVGDCMGNEIEHSGHALSDPDALTYAAEEFVIPAAKLHPGQPFQLEVEHSNMDTDIWNNIEIIVTYAATSFLDVQTTGTDAQDRGCPATPYAMDGGQTDRGRLPTAEK
ncbi:MAG: hypothetical protein ACR2Q3_07425 [Woeseiaceae bacterium]